MEIEVCALSSKNSIPEILDALFHVVDLTERNNQDSINWVCDKQDRSVNILYYSLLCAYHQITTKEVDVDFGDLGDSLITFTSEDISNPAAIKQIEHNLQSNPSYNPQHNIAITYLIDELVCNIQQHSLCSKCLLSLSINEVKQCVDICISDNGISLYGSYVKSGRYINKLGDDSISALYLAKDGFSTKNRPDAENRGYGISSNLKMVVDGLGGDFTIISGNALYINIRSKEMLVGLPRQIDWQGTTIIARIPLRQNHPFNLYDYIS